MIEKPKLVSVIIPCYQQISFLHRALNSVAAQSYRPVEAIVIDDGSEPAVSISSNDYPIPVIVIRQDNQGLPAARNVGLKAASGSFVKFLDADDELLPDCLFEQMSAIDDKNRVISCIGYREFYDDTGQHIDIIRGFGNPLHAALLVNLNPVHCYLFRKDDLLQANGFDLSPRTRGGHEDYDLLLRLLVSGIRIITHHTVGVVYHRYSGTMSTNKTAMDRTRASVWAYSTKQLLSRKDLKPSTVLMVLTCFSHIAKITPTKYSDELQVIREMLLAILTEMDIAFDDIVIHTLIDELSQDSANLPLVRILQNNKPDNVPYGAYWEPQELIDSRVVLAKPASEFRDEYLIDLFNTIRVNKRIGVYGAGELGQRLVNLITSAGAEVEVLFDQNWRKVSSVNGIPVIGINKENVASIDVIIVASLVYRKEIIEFLSTSYPSIKLF